jgi:hypothetical protein
MNIDKLTQRYALEGFRRHLGKTVTIKGHHIAKYDNMRVIAFDVTITGVLKSVDFHRGYLMVEIHNENWDFIVNDFEVEGI